MRFVLFGNTYEAEKSAYVEQLFRILSCYGDEVYVESEFYFFLRSKQLLTYEPAGVVEGLGHQNFDMAISLGGDGTFLKVAHAVGSSGIPIVGVNTGRLGFLADVSPSEMEQFFAQLHKGCYSLRERSLIEIVTDDATVPPSYALNEVAISKHDSLSMIAIRTAINGEHLITYMADGLLVATPTGSTAYALSSGGPIVYPQADVFVLTAVAPHSLSVRPIVISDEKHIRLEVESRSGSFLVAVDGVSRSYKEGTVLSIRKANYKVRVVKQEGNSFFYTLQKKLLWGTDPRG